MTSYTVHKILTHNSLQLLLVQKSANPSDPFELCIYNEHTGNTVMRLTHPTLEEFTRAIAILKDEQS